MTTTMNRRKFLLTSGSLTVGTLGLDRFAGSAQAQERAEKLHVVFAIDTLADTIGPGMKVNLGKLKEVFGEVWSERVERFTYGEFTESQIHPRTILDHVRSLQVGAGESVLFYYCGHGGWDAKANGYDGAERGHFLATSGGNLYRSELRQALLAKKLFGACIITDCCSSIAGIEPPRRNVPAKWEGFQDLFFERRGLTDIQATTRGHFGWSSNPQGGIFTRALTKLLCEPRANIRGDGQDGFLSWQEFFPRLRGDTVALFNDTQAKALPRTDGKIDIRDYQAQTPEAFYLAEWPGRERYVKVVNNTGQRLCVVVKYHAWTKENGWQWHGGTNGLQYEFAPGQSGQLRDGWMVRADRISYRAWTATKRWTQYASTPRPLVPPDGYRKGSDLGTYTLSFV